MVSADAGADTSNAPIPKIDRIRNNLKLLMTRLSLEMKEPNLRNRTPAAGNAPARFIPMSRFSSHPSLLCRILQEALAASANLTMRNSARLVGVTVVLSPQGWQAA